MPEIAGGSSGPGFGGKTLEACYARKEDLERQLRALDLAAPGGATTEMELQTKLQRIAGLINLVVEMQKDRHDVRHATLRNIT